jgi:hypothetical protein
VVRPLLLLGALACNGCTVAGAIIGSTIPKQPEVPEAPLTSRASEGERIEVETRNRRTVSGVYGGTYDEKLWVATDSRTGTEGTDVRDVKSARLHRDDYFLEGLLTGLALDLTAIAVAGATASSWLPKTDNSYHFGADGVDVSARR